MPGSSQPGTERGANNCCVKWHSRGKLTTTWMVRLLDLHCACPCIRIMTDDRILTHAGIFFLPACLTPRWHQYCQLVGCHQLLALCYLTAFVCMVLQRWQEPRFCATLPAAGPSRPAPTALTPAVPVSSQCCILQSPAPHAASTPPSQRADQQPQSSQQPPLPPASEAVEAANGSGASQKPAMASSMLCTLPHMAAR